MIWLWALLGGCLIAMASIWLVRHLRDLEARLVDAEARLASDADARLELMDSVRQIGNAGVEAMRTVVLLKRDLARHTTSSLLHQAAVEPSPPPRQPRDL